MASFSLSHYVYLIALFATSPIYSNILQSQYCASVFTEKDYKGFELNVTSVTSDHRWNYIRHHNLIPNSVKVKTNCALTIFDNRGNIQTIHDNITELVSSKNPLHLSCCQCEGCDSFKDQQNLECARIFQYEKCSGCIGSHMNLKNGQEIKDFSSLHDQVSSVVVRDGCDLLVSYQVHYAGLKLNLKVNLQTGDNLMESQGLFNEQSRVLIRKAKCICQESSRLGVDSLEVEEIKVVELKRFIKPSGMEQRDRVGSKESSSGSVETVNDQIQDVSQSEEDLNFWPVY